MDREAIHILLVEDSETQATLIRDALESGHTPVKLTVARNLAEAHACLSASFPHLAIIDLLLPDGNGVDLLSSEKEKQAYPVVIMSSQGDEQAAVEAMKAGAVDYVVKSAATLADLPRIVERALREWRHITERKQAQEALRESEERFRSFFESAASGMAIFDLEGRTQRVNPTFCRLSGYSEAEAMEKNILEVTHPDDREKTRHLYNEIRMGRRRVIDYEKRYLCKDGSVIWGRATVAAVFGPDGALRYFAANVHDITEHKRVQDQIRESKQMLQLVLDYIPQHVFWKDRNSVYRGCNRNFAQAAGMERPQDLIGKTDYDLAWKREEADFFRECDRRVMETDTPELHIIEPQLQAGGKQAWLDTNKIPLHNGEDRVVGILGTFEDITERKQSEGALRESEERFRSVFESAAAGMVVLSLGHKILQANSAFCDFTGYAEAELLDLSIEDVTHPDDRERTFQNYRKLLSGQSRALHYEKRYQRKDGQTVWAQASASCLIDAGYCIGLVQDITERKQAEEALQAAHRQLQDIIDFLPDATFVIDRESKLVAWNRGMEEMTGVPKKDILGRGNYAYANAFYGSRRPMLVDLLAKADPTIEAKYDLLKRQGQSLYAEGFVASLYNGKGAYLWGKASPLLDQEGNRVGAIESLRDITERKQAEEDLKEVNRALDAFVYTVSHDLRSPLTPIIGYADFLRENYSDRLDEQALNCLADISTAGGKMVALMEDLLTLAKVGQLELPAEPFDTGEVVNEVVRAQVSQFSLAEVAVEVSDLPPLRLPKTFLTQIFDNLIGNAVRYAGRGGRPIEVGGERRGDLVRLYVCDHGPGIPAEERSRIFEVFYRGATGKKFPGTGVGLATVQKITRLYKGQVWVEETEGGGSTFLVEMVDIPVSGPVK